MKHHVLKRFLPVLLAIALVCGMLSGCSSIHSVSLSYTLPSALSSNSFGSFSAASDSYVDPVRTPVDFSEMTDDNYDETAMMAALDHMEANLDDPSAVDSLKADWDVIVDQFDRLYTDLSLDQLYYFLDASDPEASARFAQINATYQSVADQILTVLHDVLGASCREELIAYIACDPLIEQAADYTTKTEEEFALLDKMVDLLDTYYSLITDTGNRNQTVPDLYLELLDTLIELNSYTPQYATYAHNAYSLTFYRDFLPEDTDILYTWVKEFIVPYYQEILDCLTSHSGLIRYYTAAYSSDEIPEMVKPYLTSVSPLAAEAFQTMMDHHLYDIAPLSTKNQGAFTLTLPYYGVPFIYNNPTGTAADVGTIIHEFGHFYSSCATMRPAALLYTCYDTAEIDSQGLEMLMLHYGDELYGEELSDLNLLLNLHDMLYSIIDGCLFDEFQKAALFGRMDETINSGSDLTSLYLEIERSYFGNNISDWGMNWFMVNHTFEQPFYYISYATSATAALGILTRSLDDFDQAVDLYNELIAMGNDYGFCATLDYLGLPNPLKEEGLEQLTEGLSEFLDAMLEYFTSVNDTPEETPEPILPAGSSETSLTDSKTSAQSDGWYECSIADIAGYFSPKDWYLFSEEEILDTYGTTTSALGMDGEDQILEDGGMIMEFIAARYDGEANTNVVITRLPAIAMFSPERMVVEQSLDATVAELSKLVTVTDYKVVDIDFLETTHSAMWIKGDAGGTDVYETIVFVKDGRDIIQFTALSYFEDTTQDILANYMTTTF